MSLIYQSRKMLDVLEQAKKFAHSSMSVLITGEHGTGKELIAKSLHQMSDRNRQSYLRVNCAAFAQNLIESELFGHEVGAFTGAVQRRHGQFENAGDGTLFLDEIGELALSDQVKLLRVLEEREFQRVGGNEVLYFSGRILAATNRDLLADVNEDRFRADLYYRLSVLVLRLPPLRERPEDIPPLVQHFIKLLQPELTRKVRGVSRSVMKSLSDYYWPGNVRELRNVIIRACYLAESDVIETVDLPLESQHVPIVNHVPDQSPELFERMSLDEIERNVILNRLKIFHGNKEEAAAALGVTARTLRNKVSQYRKLGYVG
ncbi:sigma-54 interaction domain-containing protein [Planctomicrobium sp. SH668]|uniref:sigma-54 interaction domain-containing protein n=1 Tax=Planctomicrobium sp. SH668 TaxID=3448126 RepID=UPI003F5CA16A